MTDKQKAAMAAGRARAREARRAIAIEKVAAFGEWVKADAVCTGHRAAGRVESRPPMPALPTSVEYKLARGEDLEDDA